MVGAAQPVADEQGGAGEPGRHRVAVAPEGHRGVVGDGAFDHDRGREGQPWQGQQRLGVGQRRHGRAFTVRAPPLPGVAGRGTRRVEGRWAASGSSPTWCATTDPSRSAPRTRPHPCGCPAGADTARRPPRSAWPPGRRWAGRHGCPARSPWPAGRCARSGPCRPGAASPRPWPRSRWAWSIDSASTPRTVPECGSVPRST